VEADRSTTQPAVTQAKDSVSRISPHQNTRGTPSPNGKSAQKTAEFAARTTGKECDILCNLGCWAVTQIGCGIGSAAICAASSVPLNVAAPLWLVTCLRLFNYMCGFGATLACYGVCDHVVCKDLDPDCPSGQEKCGTRCYRDCPSPKKRDPFHCPSCICPPISCSSPFVPDLENCRCKCRDTFCAAPKTFLDPADCQCKCPPKSCPSPKVLDPNDCQCKCPPGMSCNPPKVLNPNTCQCECPSCNPPKVLNPDTCECKCPPGISCTPPKVLNPNTCRCECQVDCDSPKVLNPSTCTCQCPSTYSVECPAGYGHNGCCPSTDPVCIPSNWGGCCPENYFGCPWGNAGICCGHGTFRYCCPQYGCCV
jgi:hypothetical protein